MLMLRNGGVMFGFLARNVLWSRDNEASSKSADGLHSFEYRSFLPKQGAPRGYCATNDDVRSFKAGQLYVGVCVAQNGRDYQEDSWLAMARSIEKPSSWVPSRRVTSPEGSISPTKKINEVRSDQNFSSYEGSANPIILAVFDGHGGAECSRFLTEKFPVVFERMLAGSGRVGNNGTAKCRWVTITSAVSNALLEIDDLFQNHRSNHGYVGSTATVVAIGANGDVSCANAGDSRAVLIRSNRRVLALSSDHSPLTRPDEVERIDAAGGYFSPGPMSNQAMAWLSGVELCPRVYHKGFNGRGGLNMTRAVGDTYLKPLVIANPETLHTTIQAGDKFIIVASDGLWDVLSNEEVGEIVSNVSSSVIKTHETLHGNGEGKRSSSNNEDRGTLIDAIVRQSSLALVCEAQTRGSSDNVTVLVARL